MRRRIVLISLLVVLVGITIWVTNMGKVGIFNVFTYEDIFVFSLDHLVMVFWPLLFGIVIGVFLGVIVTRPGFSRLSVPVIGLVSMGQAMPSLAVIAIMAILPLSLWGFFNFGFNFQTAVVALLIYGLMPILRNSYASVNNIDRAIIESAEGMGMTKWQIFRKIELPMALPVIITGIRISAVVTVGTAELAVLVGGKGLGTITFTGVFAQQPLIIIQGAAPTAILAISLGIALELIENWITPRGLKIRAGNS
ncbi:ABC transporter permease [Chloroflexota bacterium]